MAQTDDNPPALSAEATPRLALIVAVARNGVIGVDNRLPWRLAPDLRRFRALTTGHAIVMGRRTWESIGRPLPGRQSIVVTRQRDYRADGADVAPTLTEALAKVAMPLPAFCIGGGELYRDALPLADVLHVTEIHRDFDGDARFPAIDPARWREAAREEHRDDPEAPFGYAYVTYVRRA